MKLIKIVLCSLMAALPATANAEDIQDPFYRPQAGHFLSETVFSFAKAKLDFGVLKLKPEQKVLSEQLTYGITSGLFAEATFANSWVDLKSDMFEKYESRYWDAGLAYRMAPAQNTALTVGAYYTENRDEGQDRENTVEAKALLELMKDQILKPFAAVAYERDAEYFSKSHDNYNFEAGLWAKADKISVKTAVSYVYNHHDTVSSTYIDVEADCALAENIAVGAGFSSLLHEHNTLLTSQTTYGAQIKLVF